MIKTPYLVLFIVLISVGVGTASALITITLAGDVEILGFLSVDGDTFLEGDLNVDGDTTLGQDLFAGDASFNNVDLNGDLIVDTNTLAVKSASDKVGVGTLTPTATLHIVGDCIGCMAFYEVSATSLIAGLNDLSCNPGDRVISGGGYSTSNGHTIRESWAFDFDTWRLSMVDNSANPVEPGAFKIICAELEGDKTPPLAPTLLTPVNEAVIDRSQTPTILFSWSQPTDLSFCCVYNFTVLDGEAQVVYNINTNTNDDDASIANFPLNDQYFWNVKATDGNGNEGSFAIHSLNFTIVP